MNENLDLVKILKNCPSGTTFWSKLHGEVTFKGIEEDNMYFPIRILYRTYKGCAHVCGFSKEGFYSMDFSGECLLVPSKEQQDWSKFSAPWYKKDRFNPETLQPFDKVLVRYSDSYDRRWICALYSHKRKEGEKITFKYATSAGSYAYCIPYNNNTKYLIGTKEEAPEYYRYWED